MLQVYKHSCLHAQPNTAVSSKAWNRVEEGSEFPARNELQSYKILKYIHHCEVHFYTNEQIHPHHFAKVLIIQWLFVAIFCEEDQKRLQCLCSIQ